MSAEQLRASLLDAYSRGEPAVTVELAQRYLAGEPSDRTALLIYGNVLTELGRYVEALEALQRAETLSSAADRQSVARELGRLHDQWGRPVEAERFYREVIDLRPGHTSAYIYLGTMLAGLGRLPEAEQALSAATMCSEGELSEVFFNLGLVRRTRRDYFGALESLRRAVELDPHYAAAKEALRDVERVLFDFPDPET